MHGLDDLGQRGGRVDREPAHAAEIGGHAAAVFEHGDSVLRYVRAAHAPSSKPIDACAPSQNGLFSDAPHLHNVTRLRTS